MAKLDEKMGWTYRTAPPREATILEGELQDVPGRFVFDADGYYRGFISTNNQRFGGIIPGPDGTVAGVLLPDGTLQNPDGTKSKYTDPIKYLLTIVEPIREPEYHLSNLVNK